LHTTGLKMVEACRLTDPTFVDTQPRMSIK
jgi:hypothetical protein